MFSASRLWSAPNPVLCDCFCNLRSARREYTTVVSYRFYLLKAGHCLRIQNLDCLSDEDAISQARQFTPAYEVDLWEGDRRIGRYTTVATRNEFASHRP